MFRYVTRLDGLLTYFVSIGKRVLAEIPAKSFSRSVKIVGVDLFAVQAKLKQLNAFGPVKHFVREQPLHNQTEHAKNQSGQSSKYAEASCGKENRLEHGKPGRISQRLRRLIPGNRRVVLDRFPQPVRQLR